MADVIDLSGVEREIRNLERQLHSDIAAVDTKVVAVAAGVAATQAELLKLQKDFQAMLEEQRKTAALEQASTELITVRQEMEKKFGNYRAVRNSMIGILQATDAALVKKVTVSQVSEELMISTPDYWLAPVLVALAAWIGNDRDLADRAIREAVKRDNEHTSLVMALICRRNNRTQTCYEWLSRFFATQDASSFEEDDMVYIDAYINGIFGPDEKHMCDGFVARWVDEIRGQNSHFEKDQEETWQEYFNSYNVNEGAKYPALQENCKEFGYIDGYLGRIDAVDSIVDNFQEIGQAYVDQDALREAVDKHLIQLVSADDKAERSLRQQEEYLLAVKATQGDVNAARTIVNKRRIEKQQKTMDLVSHLTHSITDRNSASARPSVQKTAVSFLGNYINTGFANYISEKQSLFPQEISIDVNGWTGKTADGNNQGELEQSYADYLIGKKKEESEEAARKNNPKGSWIASVIFLVLGIVLLFTSMKPLGVIGLIIGLITLIVGFRKKKAGEQAQKELDEKYASLMQAGKQKIDDTADQWKAAREAAQAFDPGRIGRVVA